MNPVAQTLALLSAVVYLGAAPAELVFFDRPAVRRFLHVEADNVADVRMWAFVVGFRNALAGVAALVGLVLLRVAGEDVGTAVVATALGYMLLASLAMGVSDAVGFWRPRGGSVVGTVGSSIPPLAALLALVL